MSRVRLATCHLWIADGAALASAYWTPPDPGAPDLGLGDEIVVGNDSGGQVHDPWTMIVLSEVLRP